MIGSMPRLALDDIGDVGAEEDEGRMRDVDDVEHAERDRDAGGDGGVETAEQQPGDDRIDQEIDVHAVSAGATVGTCAFVSGAPGLRRRHEANAI